MNRIASCWNISARRRGGISPLLILSIGVLFGLVALAVDTANLWQARLELRNSVDAAAMAAAHAWADDRLLAPTPTTVARVAATARRVAIDYGRNNPVLGQPLHLRDNPENAADGDIVFGFIDEPLGRRFQAAKRVDSPFINAVRIVGRRTRARGNPAGMYFGRLLGLPSADVVTSATAMLDRYVIGFRPIGRQPIPLAPIALLSDPTLSHPNSWESEVLKPVVPGDAQRDRFRFDQDKQRFFESTDWSAGDGIPEMHVYFSPPDGSSSDGSGGFNGCFLFIGGGWDDLTRQIASGIGAEDLVDSDGQILLGADNRCYFHGTASLPPIDDPRTQAVWAAVQALQVSARPVVWPLFRSIASGRGNGVAEISGFVAARLVRAEWMARSDDHDGTADGRLVLSLTLQPCQLVTATAVTDNRRRVGNGVDLYNRYICRIRLVE